MVRLDGRVALITGSRRLGADAAIALAAAGADVALVYHTGRAAAEQAARRVHAAGRRALVLHADLRDPTACSGIVDATVSQMGRLDVLLNMASCYRQRAFADLTVEDWDAPFAVDLRASWLCTRAAVPHMRSRQWGRVINMSDAVAVSGRPPCGYLPYYVAKSGIIALTQALALELAPHGILVNAVALGAILPPPEMPAAAVEEIRQHTPTGRWGGARAATDAVLATLASDYLTGETIRVDGGSHLR